MYKKLLYFGILALMAAAVFSSCVSQKGGCQATSGYSGYGH